MPFNRSASLFIRDVSVPFGGLISAVIMNFPERNVETKLKPFSP
jgi:hypothetical protein